MCPFQFRKVTKAASVKQNKTLDLYKQLGPLILCGVLHVTYSSPTESAAAGFMVCVLFSSHILFASMNDNNRRLEALMCLHIPDLKIDTLHNGEGDWTFHHILFLD